MTETIDSFNNNNINEIIDKISNLNINIDDETGEIKSIEDPVKELVIKTRSGRVITKPLIFTYEKETKAPIRKKEKREKRERKTKDDIVYRNYSGDITIVLDQTSGCNLYNKKSHGNSNDKKPWKQEMREHIEKIMNKDSSEMEKYKNLIDYRNSISHNCNFWMTKKMLEEYSNILRTNSTWREKQQEIIDRYKMRETERFKKQLNSELNRELNKLDQEIMTRDPDERSISRSRSRSRSRSDDNKTDGGGLYRKTKKVHKKQQKTKKKRKVQKKQQKTKKNKNVQKKIIK